MKLIGIIARFNFSFQVPLDFQGYGSVAKHSHQVNYPGFNNPCFKEPNQNIRI